MGDGNILAGRLVRLSGLTMPRNVLLDESKNDRWPGPAALAIDKVRIQPTLASLFEEARPATVGKGDHLLHSTLRYQLIADIVAPSRQVQVPGRRTSQQPGAPSLSS